MRRGPRAREAELELESGNAAGGGASWGDGRAGEEVGRRARTCSLSISSSSQLADVSRSTEQELESACVAEASEVEGKTLLLKHGERRGVGVAASR